MSLIAALSAMLTLCDKGAVFESTAKALGIEPDANELPMEEMTSVHGNDVSAVLAESGGPGVCTRVEWVAHFVKSCQGKGSRTTRCVPRAATNPGCAEGLVDGGSC